MTVQTTRTYLMESHKWDLQMVKCTQILLLFHRDREPISKKLSSKQCIDYHIYQTINNKYEVKTIACIINYV